MLFSSVQFSCSVMSDSLQPHGLQHARPPCPSPAPGVYSNSYPLSRWCHPTISSSLIPFSSPPSIFPSIRGFSSELILCIRWPKYWSFSFSISTAETHALETDGKSSLKKILSDFSYTVHLSNLDWFASKLRHKIVHLNCKFYLPVVYLFLWFI